MPVWLPARSAWSSRGSSGQDRGDAWQGAETLEVRAVLEQRVGAGLQGLPQLGQPSDLGKLEVKRLDRDRIHGDGQGDASVRQLVEFLQLGPLVHLPADPGPGR